MKNEELTREELRQKTLKFIDVMENKVTDVESIHWFLNIDSSPFWRYIRELVEDYDPDTAMWMDRYHEAGIEIGKLKKQLDDEREYTKGYKVIQPKVSREDIQKLAEDIESVLDNIIPNSDAIAYSAVLVEHIGSWLKSKGIEIEK